MVFYTTSTFSVFKEMVLVFETEMNSANICTPLLKGSLNIRKLRCFKKSRLWSCDVFVYSVCAVSHGLHPLHKHSRCTTEGDSSGVHLRSVFTEDTAASTSAQGLHQNPPKRAGERTQWVSAAPLEAPSPRTRSDLLGSLGHAPSAATALRPGHRRCTETFLPLQSSLAPASLIYLEMTLLLQCITSETNAPLYNIITILLQSLPQRDISTAATMTVPR